jgi:hypothetical protein
MIIDRRVSAEIEGDFVVFMIGVRLNKPWKPSWWPVFSAMPRMLKELSQKPELGLLHYRLHFGFPNSMVIQYWRAIDRLRTKPRPGAFAGVERLQQSDRHEWRCGDLARNLLHFSRHIRKHLCQYAEIWVRRRGHAA